MTLADQAREIVRSRGLSAYELGELAGVNRSTIGRFLAGADIGLETFGRIAGVLGIRLAETSSRRRKAHKETPDPSLQL